MRFRRVPILLLTAVLSLLLCAPASAASSSGFQKVENAASAGVFADVPADKWYAQSVKTACEYGIMNGVSRTSFDGEGTFSYAQAICVASRLHNICYGNGETFRTDGVWYQPYVEYAEEHSLILGSCDYDSAIRRGAFAELISAALPDRFLSEINRVEGNVIPDVEVSQSCYSAVYRLYRAGILTGNDDRGRFAPSSLITRGESAAILSRVVEPAQRRRIILVAEAGADTAQRLYDVLEDGLRKKVGLADNRSYIDVSSFGLSNADGSRDRTLLNKIFRMVVLDHPEFFYATGGYARHHLTKDPSVLVGVRPFYEEFVQEPGVFEKFDAAVEDALAQVKGVSEPLEQLLILCDYLGTRNVYNWEVATGQEDYPKNVRNAYSALVTGDTVCRGYAHAYQVLLQKLGIPCYIAGSAEMDHVWNIVQLDGEWYHVDVNRSNNTVPSLKGRCRHGAFLLSDAALRALDYHDWSIETYQGNAMPAPACSSRKFETGWAFNDQTDFALYRRDGGYYYIRSGGTGKVTLYFGPLSGAGKEITTLPLYIVQEDGQQIQRSGIVWLNGQLYYVNRNQELVRYDLKSGKTTALGKVPFTAQGSPDGYYPASSDGIGLSYNEAAGKIVAISRTRRTELAQFDP